MIFVNFKSYQQAIGKKAVQLAEVCQQVDQDVDPEIIPSVGAADIFRVADQLQLPVWAQHCDPKESNRNTGWLTPLAVKRAGAKGVFLNHSEHQLNFQEISSCLQTAKELSLKTLVFVDSLKFAKKVDQLDPDYLAFEEPHLVAGDRAIVEFEEEQEKINRFAASVDAVPLTGAGIKTSEDVSKSLQLGVKGVVVASGIVKADSPREALLELVAGFH